MFLKYFQRQTHRRPVVNVTQYIPYCGAPPIPGHVSWNTDPVLGAALFGVAVLYTIGARRQQLAIRPQIAFWSGWAILTLALVSPLCNLSVALFSARIAQHVILTLIAAPLLVLGRLEVMLAVHPASTTRLRPMLRTVASTAGQWTAVLLFALLMWLWHVPATYDATFASTLIYWSMHVTMIGAALLFWAATLRTRTSVSTALSGIFVTMLQMSLLGAIFTFAGSPLFVVHAATTWPWGLSQLQDQALGGLIMWVVGGAVLAVYASFALASYMVEEPADPLIGNTELRRTGLPASA
jgi:putative membrane protein